MISARIARPQQIRGSLATLALATTLAACGSGANAGNDSTLVAPPTKVAWTTASAAPSVAAMLPSTAPSAAPSATAAAAPASTYGGARWQGLPTPGTLGPHQEETSRYSIFVAGTQDSVVRLYTDAFLADGWGEASRTTGNGSQFFTFVKSGRSVVVAVGPDLGTESVIVVIDATL